jgi:SSS family solute:Na+ symporter
VARRGIFVSIGCWALFDFMTTGCGLYARAILPNLADPVTSFPSLAAEVLPVGLLGLFVLAILATVMSTVDSYAFLAASTFGNDIMRRFGLIDEASIGRYTRVGLAVTLVLAIVLALFFKSVVEIWYLFGSIGTPALLVPVFTSFVGRRRLSAGWAMVSIALSGTISLTWWLSQFRTAGSAYWYGLEPIFPGLALSLGIFLAVSKRVPESLPK